MRSDKTDRMVGCGFVLVPPAVLIGLAIPVWPRWEAWAAVIMAAFWLLFWVGGVISACGGSRAEDESATIETINIALIAEGQRGNDMAWKFEKELFEHIENHPGYENNSGIRRWKSNAHKEKFMQVVGKKYLQDGMELAKK